VSRTLIILIILIAVLAVAIYYVYQKAKKMQAQQDEYRAQLEAAKQKITMLVIDKKKMKLKDSGVEKAIIENTPKRYRSQKVPVLKVKAGPRVMNLLCESDVFEKVPLKKEVVAWVSGVYVMEVKGLHKGQSSSNDDNKKEDTGVWATAKKKARQITGLD